MSDSTPPAPKTQSAPKTPSVSASGSQLALGPRPASPAGLLYTILRHRWGLSHEDAVRQVEATAHEASLAA